MRNLFKHKMSIIFQIIHNSIENLIFKIKNIIK